MTLICGNNVSLDALDGKTDEIEELLAQGKDGLASLASKVSEATSALESLKVPIPSVALPNLQNEINSIVTSLTSDLETAIPGLTSKLAELQTTFSGLPSDELQGYMDQITSIVTGAVSSGGLSGFDPCSLFPNKEVATDGAIVEKAKAVKTPNTNATEPEESAAVVKTVTESLEEQPSQKASEASPSKKSYDEVMKEWDRVTGVIYPMSEVYWKGLKDDAVKAYDDYKAANISLKDELINLQRETGQKAELLYKNNGMSESLTKYYEKEQELQLAVTNIGRREGLYYDTEDGYLQYLAGLMLKRDWDVAIAYYEEHFPDDYFKWFQVQTQWDKEKQVVIDRAQYLNLDNNVQ